MLKNYLKVAARDIVRHKGYTLINVVGLAVGLACGFLVLLYVLEETGYDTCHVKKDRICRVLTDERQFEIVSASAPFAMGDVLREECPEVESVARVRTMGCYVRHEGELQMAGYVMSAEQDIFDVFTIPMVQGDPATALSQPSSLVISESVASKYFGDSDPMGQSLTLVSMGQEYDLNITGVTQDPPRKSTIRTNFLASIDVGTRFLEYIYRDAEVSPLERWGVNAFGTFILLHEGADPASLQARFAAMEDKYLDASVQHSYLLQPMSDFYLHSDHVSNNFLPHGNITYIYIFSAIALLVLSIACINFVILSTARSADRAREMGMRKVVGARRSDLIGQVLMESVLTAVVALPLAIVLVELALPHVNQLFRTGLTADYVQNWPFSLGALLTTLLVGILSGAYLALHLSGLRPVQILRGHERVGRGRAGFRRILIVVQLTIFVALIFCTGVVYKQIRYATQEDLGFDRDNLVGFRLPSRETLDRIELIKSKLTGHPGVVSVSGASMMPPTDSWGRIMVPMASDPEVEKAVEVFTADCDLVRTLGLQLVAGRDLSPDLDGPGSNNTLINETAVRELGIENPIGQQIAGYNIVGVVRDYHVHSFRHEIQSLFISVGSDHFWEMLIRIRPENVAATLEFITAQYREFYPDGEAGLTFFDDSLEAMYMAEERFGRIVGYFTLLAVMIACLGLIGLSSYVARQRTKEIGVRKVLGASVSNIVALLSKEFALLVLISGLIAWPVGQWVMMKWLEKYAYRVEIGFDVPTLAVLAGLVLTMATVGIQGYRAALSNPVDSLKQE